MLNKSEKDLLHKIVKNISELNDMLTDKAVVHHLIEITEKMMKFT